MAKKWNKVIARIEALEDALARMLTGGRKSKKNKKKKKAKKAKARRTKSRTKTRAKAARSKSVPSKTVKSKRALKPAKVVSAPKPRRARKPRPAAEIAGPLEMPLITL